MTSETEKQPMKVVWTICGTDITIEADESGNVYVNGKKVELAKVDTGSVQPKTEAGGA